MMITDSKQHLYAVINSKNGKYRKIDTTDLVEYEDLGVMGDIMEWLLSDLFSDGFVSGLVLFSVLYDYDTGDYGILLYEEYEPYILEKKKMDLVDIQKFINSYDGVWGDGFCHSCLGTGVDWDTDDFCKCEDGDSFKDTCNRHLQECSKQITEDLDNEEHCDDDIPF